MGASRIFSVTGATEDASSSTGATAHLQNWRCCFQRPVSDFSRFGFLECWSIDDGCVRLFESLRNRGRRRKRSPSRCFFFVFPQCAHTPTSLDRCGSENKWTWITIKEKEINKCHRSVDVFGEALSSAFASVIESLAEGRLHIAILYQTLRISRK